MTPPHTSNRICPICEAGCGLAVTSRGREIVGLRGDPLDFFSMGHVCPKGFALKELDTDPDRLRQPLVRRGDKLQPASWAEAFETINRNLTSAKAAHGPGAIAVYAGNPVAHNFALVIGFKVLSDVLATPNVYTGSMVDQMPKQFACGLMFGDGWTVPVPDIDRCDYLLMLGANPAVSNGSLWMVPNFRGRLGAMQQRGGRLVVVDPRKSETSALADAHHFIRPGTDAHFLLGLLGVIFRKNLVEPGRLREHLSGYEVIASLAAKTSPEEMGAACGIPAAAIEEIAHDLTAAGRAAVYGRMGTTTQRHGSVVSWLIEVVNIVTGNLDRPGGAMFSRAPAFAENTKGAGGSGGGIRAHRYRSRVSGHPEIFGELPIACLAEEIEQPGPGRVRALISIAGNPIIGAPNGPRLDAALGQLDFMLAVDVYLTETARRADVVLPGTAPFEKSHYDLLLSQVATRNVARYSPALFDLPEEHFSEWEIMLELTAISMGMGVLSRNALKRLEDMFVRHMLAEAFKDPHCVAYGRDVTAAMAEVGTRGGVERLLDVALRTGPYGDGFGAHPGGLTLARLKENPRGIDLGPLTPRVPEVLRTPSGKIEMAPDLLVAEAEAILASADACPPGSLLLIGRRQTRSHNSWMHNLPVLAKGPFRCTLMVNPADAVRLRLEDGGRATVRSRVGIIEVLVEVSDEVMPGVVSLPHGWGHTFADTALNVARIRPGVNSNILSDDTELEALTGTAILNGIPVEVESIYGEPGGDCASRPGGQNKLN